MGERLRVPTGYKLEELYKWMDKFCEARRPMRIFDHCTEPPSEMECYPVAVSSDDLFVRYLKPYPEYNARKGQKIFIDLDDFWNNMEFEYLDE